MNDLVGKRVRLIRCNDPYTKLLPGMEGTVCRIDDIGTVHVKWDNGSRLGMCEDDGDMFAVVNSKCVGG